MSDNEQIILEDIDKIVGTTGNARKDLIPILQAIQKKYTYLPEEALRRVCEISDITPAAITGVSTFYSHFRHKPAGRHSVKVCIGTACHVKGASNIVKAFKKHLAIPDEEDTDSDRLFTVKEVSCLGCCMLAPAVQVDDITYGFVEPKKVSQVLTDFLESQNSETGSDEESYGIPTGEIKMCMCSSCVASGASKVRDRLSELKSELHLPFKVKTVGCKGISYQTPMVEVALNNGHNFTYGRVKPENLRDILLRHFTPSTMSSSMKGVVAQLLDKLYTKEAREPVTRYAVDVREGAEADYCNCQMHLATEGAGDSDPLDIDDYFRLDGFKALKKCVSEMDTDEVIHTLTHSGLRGRGGAGYPTGDKWNYVNHSSSDIKYVLCNGDEGDPGAFMDRMILESFPFRVLEGMLIAAKTLGADKGFLYIRAEYPLAIQRVSRALEILREKNLLGDDILKSGWDFDLEVVQGAGAFVCGEETALISAIEGKRGMPRYRPPFPAEKGLYGKPTLVNNVETYSLIPWILRHGADEFHKLGTEESKGTKAFALAGKVRRGGLIEVPMGITLREIVEEIGGGVPDGHNLKAVQVGGPSGGCVPVTMIDTEVDYNALIHSGAIMGSGGLVVLDDTDCMVDIAKYFLSFTQIESCGKCTYCRIGTKRMLEILERLCDGEGKRGDIEELEHLAEVVQEGSLCGLGRTAPNPVLSTIKHFREEYEAHINGECPAKKCKKLITYTIKPEQCIGCTRCVQNCRDEAIELTPYQPHIIDSAKCTRCDVCRQVCPTKAVRVITGRHDS